VKEWSLELILKLCFSFIETFLVFNAAISLKVNLFLIKDQSLMIPVLLLAPRDS
jgi:hypothetical protein